MSEVEQHSVGELDLPLPGFEEGVPKTLPCTFCSCNLNATTGFVLKTHEGCLSNFYSRVHPDVRIIEYEEIPTVRAFLEDLLATFAECNAHIEACHQAIITKDELGGWDRVAHVTSHLSSELNRLSEFEVALAEFEDLVHLTHSNSLSADRGPLVVR